MRRTTIVVALFAATVASASAGANGGQADKRAKSTENVAVAASSRAPVNPSNARADGWVPPNRLNPGRTASAAAFTSARNAKPALDAKPAVHAKPAADAAQAPKAALRAKSQRTSPSRIVRAAPKSAGQRRVVRRYTSEAREVALRSEVDTTPVTGSSGGGAATGSIPALVSRMARAHGVNPALAHAVVKVESTYKPRATGPGGYIGLMQLSYQTARGMGFRGSRQALYDPSANLTYGMKYLAGAVRKSGGNTCAAVSKYQGGHGVRGVTRAGAVYCAKVKRFMAQGIPSSARVADAAPK